VELSLELQEAREELTDLSGVIPLRRPGRDRPGRDTGSPLQAA
jgi:hypothetical protein